jgi:hypothetical protein
MHKSLRIVLSLLILTFGIFIIRWRLTSHISVDYIAYWSAARLAITGGNPYSIDEMLKIEQENGWPENSGQAGLPADYAHMMFNPPWTIFFIIPFGIMDYLTSRTIFFLFCIGIIFFSVDQLWKYYGGKLKHIWIVLLLVFTFPATISLINLGNITILPLFGIVLFMLFVKQKRFFWTGTTISLVLIKPHNTYLFLLALVVWVLVEKRWELLLGAIVSIIVSISITLIFIPNIFVKYMVLISTGITNSWLNATLGSILRLKFGYDLVWLIYIPIIPGLIWFFWYWFTHYRSWNWDTAVPILLIISALTTPWGWLLDLTLVIPVIVYLVWRLMYGWKFITNIKRSGILVLFFLYIVVTSVIILERGKIFTYPHDLWWFSTFLLIIFVGMDRFSIINERYHAQNQ